MQMSAARKMRVLRAGRLIRRGQAIAHATSTLPGIAALPTPAGLRRVQRFKGRRGPFLLLAASKRQAARLVRFFSPELRRRMQSVWPGNTTLAFPARPGLAKALYLKGMLAVRVDTDPGVRLLAKVCGGLLLSSSLNRKGGPWCMPGRAVRMRWHRYIATAESGAVMAGAPSRLLAIRRSQALPLRK